jgi:hypothetical protein
MKSTVRWLLAAILLAAFTLPAFAKRDMYEQDPGFRGVEFGEQPVDGMTLVDDSQAPVLMYQRRPDSTRLGLAQVEPAKYYFHKQHGFYKTLIELRHSQNDAAVEELKKLFGAPTQVLPFGDTELVLWLRPDHTVELNKVKNGTSILKVASTNLLPLVGE